MRSHSRYQPLYLWRDLARLQSLMRAEHLIAARLEPVVQQRLDGATLDLIFAAGSSIAVVPLIDVDVVQFLEAEKDPLIWPGMVPQAAGDDVVDADQSSVPRQAWRIAPIRQDPFRYPSETSGSRSDT